MEVEIEKRFEGLKNIIDSAVQGDSLKRLEEAKVLIVGAGGLGCEAIKCLALSGIKNIHIIDMDTIELTNLNRQFLFRHKDIGRYKAEVAAEFVMKRVRGVNATYSLKRVQENTDEYYSQFDVIVGALDNDKARRWLNQLVHRLMLQKTEPGTGFYDEEGLVRFDSDGFPLIPRANKVPLYVDGGIEKLGGQAKVIIPYQTGCYSCSGVDQSAGKQKTQFCTIATKPRIPEHCVVIVIESESDGYWKKSFPDRQYDTDSFDDMNWIFQKSEEVALAFGIEGVTFEVVLGVCKNIMPNISTSNAIIASQCCTEVLKYLTGYGKNIDNDWQYKGQGVVSSIYSWTEGRRQLLLGGEACCGSCSNQPRLAAPITLSSKFSDFVNYLTQQQHILPNKRGAGDDLCQMEKKSLTSPVIYGGDLYYEHASKEDSEEDLNLTFQELIDQGKIRKGQLLSVIDEQIQFDELEFTVFNEETQEMFPTTYSAPLVYSINYN